MANLLLDTFNRADGDLNGDYATGTGQFWTSAANSFSVVSNKVQIHASAVGRVKAYISTFVKDIKLTASLHTCATANKTDIGVVIRKNATNHIYIRVRKISGTNAIAIINNADSVLAQNTSAGLADNTTYAFEVTVVGNLITVKIDGVSMVTYTLAGGETSTYVGTDVGLTANKANDSGSTLDDLTVTSLNTPLASTAQVIAHRARHGNADENAIASMLTLPIFVDGIEIDVRFTSDHVPVLMHDSTVDRTTDGSGNVTSFSAATFADLNLDGTGEPPPTLEAMLDSCANRGLRRILVDLNDLTDPTGLASAIAVVQASPVYPICIFMVRSTQETTFRDLGPDERLGRFDVQESNKSAALSAAATYAVECMFVTQSIYLTEHTVVDDIQGAGMVAGASIVDDGDNISAAIADSCGYLLTNVPDLVDVFTERSSYVYYYDGFVENRAVVLQYDGTYEFPATFEVSS